jgi:hypothetical protein
VLALLLASALRAIARGSPRLARVAPVLGLVVALALTVGAAARLAPYTPGGGSGGARPGWTSWSADPDQWLRPLITALEGSRVGGAYASYWVAYALTFDAHGRVTSADPGNDRYPPYLAAIARRRRQAWVFPRPSRLTALNAAVGVHPWLPARSLSLTDFVRYLRHHDVAYRCRNAGYFTVVYPARVVGASGPGHALDIGPPSISG